MVRFILSAVKVIWYIALAIASVAVLWFGWLVIFRHTWIGPAGPYLLLFIWLPTLAFVVISMIFVRDRSVVSSIDVSIFFILFFSFLSFPASSILLNEPSFARQQREIRERGSDGAFREEGGYRITPDEKFGYRLTIRGIYTDSPMAWLHINDIAERHSWSMRIDFDMEDVNFDELSPEEILIILTPTDIEDVYILTTTPYFKEEIEVFEVDVRRERSRRLEQ